MIIGKVLWWSERDENGIIVDPQGNEFYFDRSVLHLGPRQKLGRESLVTFVEEAVDGILVAKEVSIPKYKIKKKLSKVFHSQQLQLPLGLDY